MMSTSQISLPTEQKITFVSLASFNIVNHSSYSSKESLDTSIIKSLLDWHFTLQ